MKTRRCCTPKCPATLPPGRRQYCGPCATERIRESNRRSARDRAAGVRAPRANANTAKQATFRWVNDYLLAHPCACGEARLTMLLFIQADGQRSQVDHAVTAGVALTAIQTHIAACTTQCYACWVATQILTRPTFKFAYRLAGIVDQQRQSGDQPPGGPILPPPPQSQEGGGTTRVQLQVEGTGAADLPASQDRVEPVPQEPTDSASQVDVGHDATAVTLGDPVAEAGSSRGDDNTVDAGQEHGLQSNGGDGSVVGGIRLVRRPRQR